MWIWSDKNLCKFIIEDDLETLESMPPSEIRRICGFNIPDVYPGYGPLHLAAVHGKYDAVSLLLRARVDVNVLSTSRRTPVFLAIENGHVDILSKFVDAGADLTLLPYNIIRERNGARHYDAFDMRTALHWATYSGYYDVVRFLIDNVKVDVSIRNYARYDVDEASGDTALDVWLRYYPCRHVRESPGRHHDDDDAMRPLKSPIVLLLVSALAQCGGPVPRLPSVALGVDADRTAPRAMIQLQRRTALLQLQERLTDEDHEFTVGGGLRRVRHWREATALQRRLHVRQYLPERDDYDPSSRWRAPAVVLEEAGEAGVSARRRQKQLERPLDWKRRRHYYT